MARQRLRLHALRCGMEFSVTNDLSPAARGHRILCAEDHVHMAELLKKVLTRAGHRVECVFDGQQALDRMSRDTFDVVVTDHNMPHVNGLELAARLRASGFTGRILVHTSRISPQERDAYGALEVREILMKPRGIIQLAGILDTGAGATAPIRRP